MHIIISEKKNVGFPYCLVVSWKNNMGGAEMETGKLRDKEKNNKD